MTEAMTELLEATRELEEAVLAKERTRVRTAGNVVALLPHNTAVMAAEDRLKKLVRDLERAALVASL